MDRFHSIHLPSGDAEEGVSLLIPNDHDALTQHQPHLTLRDGTYTAESLTEAGLAVMVRDRADEILTPDELLERRVRYVVIPVTRLRGEVQSVLAMRERGLKGIGIEQVTVGQGAEETTKRVGVVKMPSLLVGFKPPWWTIQEQAA